MAAPKKAQAANADQVIVPEGEPLVDADGNDRPVDDEALKTMEEQIYPVMGTTNGERVEYGPFADYRIVATPQGQFAIPAHHIMWIEMIEKWDPKNGVNKLVPKSRFRAVKTDDPRTKPHGALTPDEAAKIKEHREARAKGYVVG